MFFPYIKKAYKKVIGISHIKLLFWRQHLNNKNKNERFFRNKINININIYRNMRIILYSSISLFCKNTNIRRHEIYSINIWIYYYYFLNDRPLWDSIWIFYDIKMWEEIVVPIFGYFDQGRLYHLFRDSNEPHDFKYIYCKDWIWIGPSIGLGFSPTSPNKEFIERGWKN